MATDYRAEKAGFAKEMQDKIAEKFETQEAFKALKWISLLPVPQNAPDFVKSALRNLPLSSNSVTQEEFHKSLFDGVLLGFVMSVLDPNAVNWNNKTWQVSDKKIFEGSRQRERIGLFLNFASAYGVNNAFIFQTDQLYEKTNLCQVIICFAQLGSTAQTKPNYAGPSGYWMQKHQENKREFTEAQLKSGQTVIGLQMGTNKMANASGVSFGAQRHIYDSH